MHLSTYKMSSDRNSTLLPSESRDHAKALEAILSSNSAYETDDGNSKRREILHEVEVMFKSWCPEGRVLPIGSYPLDVHTPDTDMDLLCVAPLTYTRQLFQKEFYEKLATHPRCRFANGVFRAKVPIIKCNFMDMWIDILYAGTDSNDLDCDAGLMNLDQASVLSLNGYRNTEQILRCVPDPEIFRKTLRVVRLWAKKRGIYSGILGYLSGVSWSILVAKVCILYPTVPFPISLYKFFKVYAVWDWKSPVYLHPYDTDNVTYKSCASDTMTIITPAYPSDNSAVGISNSAFELIKSELQLAYKIIHDILQAEADWQDLFEELDFFQQFRHFVSIQISALNEEDFHIWHGLVQSKLKMLISNLENTFPHPTAILYARAFSLPSSFSHSLTYFIGIKHSFHNRQSSLDLRYPVSYFCSVLEGLRPNNMTMSLRINNFPRSQLPYGVLSQDTKKTQNES
jgi:poly(A) polymerase